MFFFSCLCSVRGRSASPCAWDGAMSRSGCGAITLPPLPLHRLVSKLLFQNWSCPWSLLPHFISALSPWTRPPQPPHESPSGAVDKVSKVQPLRIVCSLWVLPQVRMACCVFQVLFFHNILYVTYCCNSMPILTSHSMKISILVYWFIIFEWSKCIKKAWGHVGRLALVEVNEVSI